MSAAPQQNPHKCGYAFGLHDKSNNRIMARENKTMDEIHRGLLKKYHTLCTVLGLDDDAKRAILASWCVESSRDLTQHQLIDICGKLSAQVDQKQGTARLDKLRKQVIAAIGGWLRETGQQSNISIIKGIAMRASGYADFNKIPRERLRNLIATFNNKVKDARAVDALTDAMLMQHYSAGGEILCNGKAPRRFDPTLN